MSHNINRVFEVQFAARRPPTGRSAGLKGTGRLEFVSDDRIRLSFFMCRYLLGLLLAVPLIYTGFMLTKSLGIGSWFGAIAIATVCIYLCLFYTQRQRVIEIDRAVGPSVCRFTEEAVFLRIGDDEWLGLNPNNEDLVKALKDFEDTPAPEVPPEHRAVTQDRGGLAASEGTSEPRKKPLALGIAIIVVIVPAYLVYLFYFQERVTFEAVSISPDGMYKCVVEETYYPVQSRGYITVYARKNLTRRSGDALWAPLKEAEVYNDSACRSNYSIDWEYDPQHRTQKLIVFGDFGSPPFPGEIVFEMPFEPPDAN